MTVEKIGKISEEELRELREEVLNIGSGTLEKEVRLVFDGKQYALRFPKKFVEEAGLEDGEHFFKIVLEMPSFGSGKLPALSARLMRGDDEAPSV